MCEILLIMIVFVIYVFKFTGEECGHGVDTNQSLKRDDQLMMGIASHHDCINSVKEVRVAGSGSDSLVGTQQFILRAAAMASKRAWSSIRADYNSSLWRSI